MFKTQAARGRAFSGGLRSALAAAALLLALSTSAAAATRTWDGGGSNSSWTNAANWVGDVAPSAGDDLVFPAGAAQTTNNNNFPFLTRFNSITLTGGDYVIGGNLVTLSAGIKAGAGTQAVNRQGEEQELRAALVAGLNAGTETRATALRKVAESKSVYNRVYNPALVLMQYYGYLRRNPNDEPDADFSGYEFWLAKLNSFSRADEDVRDEATALARIRRAQMVEAFIDSIEYRRRFAP